MHVENIDDYKVLFKKYLDAEDELEEDENIVWWWGVSWVLLVCFFYDIDSSFLSEIITAMALYGHRLLRITLLLWPPLFRVKEHFHLRV